MINTTQVNESSVSLKRNYQHLILGGARSGKSRYAESLVAQLLNENQGLSKPPIYLATAEAKDDEMVARISKHQQDRLDKGLSWKLVEEPCDIASIIKSLTQQDVVLIECLTLWLNNCLYQDNWSEQKKQFLSALSQSSAHIVMVSNEVGFGITPDNALARQFIDEAGWLHQELATLCNHVSLITAGIQQKLK